MVLGPFQKDKDRLLATASRTALHFGNGPLPLPPLRTLSLNPKPLTHREQRRGSDEKTRKKNTRKHAMPTEIQEERGDGDREFFLRVQESKSAL
jgi:hypothetical protein